MFATLVSPAAGRPPRLALVVAIVLLIPAAAPASPPATPQKGDRVLGKREVTTRALGKDYKNYYYYPAKVEAVTEKAYELAYDDGEHGTVAADGVTAFDWKVNQRVFCRAKGEPAADYVDYKITSISADAIEDGTRSLYKTVPIAMCRSRDPLEWWTKMSPDFKDFAKHKEIAAMPKQGSTLVAPGVAKAALDRYLAGAYGGAVLQIQRCVVSGTAWETFSIQDRTTSRKLELACAVGVPVPPDPKKIEACIVLYGLCVEKYLGDQRYGGCEWENSLAVETSRIACAKVK